MQLELNAEGEVTLTNIYTGIGIKTEDGIFGIAQRDLGIEVMLDGRHAWSSGDMEPQEPITFALARSTMAHGLSTDDGLYIAYHANVSMIIHDSGVEAAVSNELAAVILNRLFDLGQRPAAD